MKKFNVLLIEDDEFLLQLYTDILTQEEYTITTASEGISAYEKIRQGGWDIVLLDVMLPRMTGIEIINKLTADATFKRNFPIVFLTNMDGSSKLDALKKLVDDCWIKSNMTPPELIEKIEFLLKNPPLIK